MLLITDTIDDVMSLTGVSSDKLFVKSEGIQLTHPLMVEISNSYSLDVSRNIPESITLTISPETDAYLMPCQIETLIPFQFVSGSGSGETVRSVTGNVAAVDISGLPSGTYYFNVLVRDEMNNLAGYDSTIVSF